MLDHLTGGHSDPALRFGPLALIRVAAIPLRRVASMATPETSALVSAVLQARSVVGSLRPLAEAHLHKLVPTLPDKKMRAAALQLQRDVHGDRRPRIKSETLSHILECLPAGARDEVCAWLQTIHQIDDLMALGQSTLDEETISRLRPALWSAIDDPSLSLGIAVASPNLRQSLDSERKRPRTAPAASRLELALLRYLLRASCKTSPFSTLMDLGVVAVKDDGEDRFPSLAGARRVTKLRVNRGILARLYSAAIRTWDRKQDTLFQPNPSIRSHSRGRVQALAAEQMVLLGWAWRQERAAQFRMHPELAEVLLSLPETFSMPWLLQRLTQAGLTDEQAQRVAGKFMDRGLILPPAAIDGFVSDATIEVRNEVQNGGASKAQAALDSIAELERSADRDRQFGWQHRIRIDETIRAAERDALEGTSIRYEPHRSVFVEESRLEGIAGTLGSRLRGLISEVADFLRDQVALRPDYVRLRDAFEKKYGTSGECTELVSFLCEQSGRFGDMPDSIEDPEPTKTAGARLGLTAFIQIADEHVVVNRVYEGVGWLTARHLTGGSPETADFHEQMRRWLQSVHAPAEPIDVPLSGHCNDLQTHPRVTRRILAWPGEPIRADRADVLSVNDVVLRLNAVTGLLELLDRERRVVAPVYLGGVLPVPSWGPVYGLTLIGSPMQVLRPSFGSLEEHSNVTFHPRQMHKRVVLARAEWSVRSSFLLESCLAARGFHRLLAVAEFCSANGIPKVFFATAQRWLNPLRTDSPINARKPTFIDTSNPFCLDLLERTAHDAGTITLTEVLPTHDQAWQIRDENYHVTELQVEMCLVSSA